MYSSTFKLILAALCFFSYFGYIFAAPVVEVVKVIQVRQDDENGDDENGSIATPLRIAYDYTSHFQYDQVPTWYTIKPTPASTLGSYQLYATGNPKPTAVPAAAQAGGQGTTFNVDHVLELQVVVRWINAENPNPGVIPDASWNALRDIVTNTSPAPRPLRTAIASQLGQFNNLGGIPSSANGSKQGAFRAALNKSTYVSQKMKYFVNGNRNYLIDRRGGILTVIANVGTALGAAGSGGAQGAIGSAISSAWVPFATGIYDQATSILVGGV